MGLGHSPSIVTSGLLVCLDAANIKSYPGSGNYWWDVSNTKMGFDIYGSPSLTTLGGATTWRLASDGQYFQANGVSVSSIFNGSNLTLEAVIYPQTDITVGDRATIIQSSAGFGFYCSLNKSNRKLSNYWYSKSPEGYFESGAAISNNTWNHVVSVWNSADGKIYQYLNNVKTSDNTSGTSGNINSTQIIIGRESSSRQFSGGIALVRMYNIALSDSQITQNFNATRGRFGL